MSDIDSEVMRQIDANQLPNAAVTTVKHLNNPAKLQSMADASHADHKAATGQVPDPQDQGYTDYQHQGAYYQPGESD